MKITYTEKNGIFYPNLALPEHSNYPIGKYGRMRRVREMENIRDCVDESIFERNCV